MKPAKVVRPMGFDGEAEVAADPFEEMQNLATVLTARTGITHMVTLLSCAKGPEWLARGECGHAQQYDRCEYRCVLQPGHAGEHSHTMRVW